jgi:hypothetical protein
MYKIENLSYIPYFGLYPSRIIMTTIWTLYLLSDELTEISFLLSLFQNYGTSLFYLGAFLGAV